MKCATENNITHRDTQFQILSLMPSLYTFFYDYRLKGVQALKLVKV